MVRPSVISLYQQAIDSGITFALSPLPNRRTLTVNYDKMKVSNGNTFEDLNRAKREFEEDIQDIRPELIQLLEQQELMKNFLDMLESSDCDNSVSQSLLRKCQAMINKRVT